MKSVDGFLEVTRIAEELQVRRGVAVSIDVVDFIAGSAAGLTLASISSHDGGSHGVGDTSAESVVPSGDRMRDLETDGFLDFSDLGSRSTAP